MAMSVGSLTMTMTSMLPPLPCFLQTYTPSLFFCAPGHSMPSRSVNSNCEHRVINTKSTTTTINDTHAEERIILFAIVAATVRALRDNEYTDKRRRMMIRCTYHLLQMIRAEESIVHISRIDGGNLGHEGQQRRRGKERIRNGRVERVECGGGPGENDRCPVSVHTTLYLGIKVIESWARDKCHRSRGLAPRLPPASAASGAAENRWRRRVR
jgi:hypothetical protein